MSEIRPYGIPTAQSQRLPLARAQEPTPTDPSAGGASDVGAGGTPGLSGDAFQASGGTGTRSALGLPGRANATAANQVGDRALKNQQDNIFAKMLNDLQSSFSSMLAAVMKQLAEFFQTLQRMLAGQSAAGGPAPAGAAGGSSPARGGQAGTPAGKSSDGAPAPADQNQPTDQGQPTDQNQPSDQNQPTDPAHQAPAGGQSGPTPADGTTPPQGGDQAGGADASGNTPLDGLQGPGASPKTDGTGPAGQDPSQYTQTFDSNFSNGLDTKAWNDHLWYEPSNPTQNYAVEDGKLKIWPQKDASGNVFNRTIDTDGKFQQKYGYFEMEAKLPVGKGTWPAFWLYGHPGDRRPEIDIMEAYAGGAAPWGKNDANGVPHPTAYGATIWKNEGDQGGFKQIDAGTDLSAGFHKYAVKWEPNKQTFYLDGKEVYSKDVAMNDPLYMLTDLWYGSASGSPDDSTPQGKGNSLEVNYVKAWQFKNPPNQ